MEYTDNDKMLKYAVQFYKTLFGKESREINTLEDDFWDDVDKIAVEENELLEAPFSEEEIKKKPLMAHMQLGLLAQMASHFSSIKNFVT
jgi:hypothetical protein